MTNLLPAGFDLAAVAPTLVLRCESHAVQMYARLLHISRAYFGTHGAGLA